ncbi:hypothetical protein [Aquimarina pacifica]|uniref:hypothetical protein n=1 Tax=Aquimarina pacifica TaxID=1296415 RepID=UPI000472A79B|nr:hypothetical protein [Aquimarina pacifica]
MIKYLSYSIIAIFGIITLSCSIEEQNYLEEEVQIFTDQNEIAIQTKELPDPVPSHKIKDINNNISTKDDVFGTEVGEQVWYNVLSHRTSFHRNGDIIEEKNIQGETEIIFTFEWEDDSFIYVLDSNRDLYLALPKWYPGLKTHAYWSVDLNGNWNLWQEFQYYILVGDECDSDTEPPTIDPFCTPNNSGGSTCKWITSRSTSFPTTVKDHRFALTFWYNLKDNCDTYLTIRQNPPPGTIIEEPKTITISYDIIDNQGNVLRTSHANVFEKIAL